MAEIECTLETEVSNWASLRPGDLVVVSGDRYAGDTVVVEDIALELGVMWVRWNGERKLLTEEDHEISQVVRNQV